MRSTRYQLIHLSAANTFGSASSQQHQNWQRRLHPGRCPRQKKTNMLRLESASRLLRAIGKDLRQLRRKFIKKDPLRRIA